MHTESFDSSWLQSISWRSLTNWFIFFVEIHQSLRHTQSNKAETRLPAWQWTLILTQAAFLPSMCARMLSPRQLSGSITSSWRLRPAVRPATRMVGPWSSSPELHSTSATTSVCRHPRLLVLMPLWRSAINEMKISCFSSTSPQLDASCELTCS